MKVKDLIAELQKCDPEVDASVGIYGCGGFDDSRSVEDVEQRAYDGHTWVQLGISVGCSIHTSKAFKEKCS